MYLGKDTDYRDEYDPDLLVAIPRQENRANLNFDLQQWRGVDLWTAYELSWLNEVGVPQVAVAELQIDVNSENIVESKSLKYYLNSFNQTQFKSAIEVAERITTDLSKLLQGEVKLTFAGENMALNIDDIPGCSLDAEQCEMQHYQPEPSLLGCDTNLLVSETLYSHLLKSNCPVTGQPDWASLWIDYQGPAIDRKSLLAYICSYRQHQDFHEHCVEQIFCDILQHCQPQALSVYARYTRRGGIDINPLRTTSEKVSIPFRRTLRQ
jgi:7-cyano-7-deazaguanine reductase